MFGWVRFADVEEQLKRQDASIRNLSSQLAKIRQEFRNFSAKPLEVGPKEEEETEVEEELEVKAAKLKKKTVGPLMFQAVG